MAVKNEHNQEKLLKFGDGILNHEMIRHAEEFLVDCLGTIASRAAGATSFHALQHFFFHHGQKTEVYKLL